MAQKRPVVPQFGNWDNEDNVPYTVYFEKARKGKNGGKMINPNDPRENPGMFPPSAQPTPSKARIIAPDEPIGRKAVRPTPVDNQSSRENGDLNNFNDGPLRTDDNVIRQNVAGSTHQNRGGSGSGSGRPGRQNVGSDHSFDRSPLYPQYQAKPIGKNSGPAWESKHSNDSNQATPGRSRMKPISTGDEYPDKGPKGAVVPRFGDWELADNFTEKFNNLREEKNSSSPMASKMSTEQTYAYRRKQVNHNKYKPRSSWFPCFRM